MIPEYDYMEQMLKYKNKSKKLLPSERSVKCDRQSCEKRRSGNAQFGLRRLHSALQLYTEAVFSASSDQALSLAVANRSATLFEMELFQACLRDISYAISLGYDTRLIHKLYLRRVKCYFGQKRYEDCERALSDCRRQVDQIDESVRGKFSQALSDLEEELSVISADGTESTSANSRCSFALSLSGGSSEHLACASPLVDLRQSEAAGRYVVATGNIAPGDTLFVERPFGCVLLSEHRLDHCHHCIRRSHCLIPCGVCAEVGFCGPVCLREALASYHRFECGASSFLDSFGIGRLALRVLLTAGRSGVDQLWRSLTEGSTVNECRVSQCHCFQPPRQQPPHQQQSAGQLREQSMSADQTEAESDTSALSAEQRLPLGPADGRYPAVFHLVTNLEQCDKRDLVEYCRAALTLYLYLSELTSFFSSDCESSVVAQMGAVLGPSFSPPPAPRLFSAALLLRHILQLIGNAHALTEVVTTDAGGGAAGDVGGRTGEVRQCRVATGVFPSASYMNHACRPSIVNSFVGCVLVVRAVEHLGAGEEVFHCYGAHFARQPTRERLSSLWQQYRFVCSCVHCTDPHLTSFAERLDGLLCGRCGSGVAVRAPSGSYTCQHCGKTGSSGNTAGIVDAIASQLQSESLSVAELLSLRERLVPLVADSHSCLGLLEDRLARLYTEQGRETEALSLLNRGVERVGARYGTYSRVMTREELFWPAMNSDEQFDADHE